MAKDIPYMSTIKNLPAIFNKIKNAQTPPKFTHDFLKSNLGFSSSGDRGIIKIMKNLGFLSSDSVPTSRYNSFRAENALSVSMASGLREGWPDIFLSDQNAHERTVSELKELFKNITGKSDAVSEKLASTFSALCKISDFSDTPGKEETDDLELPPLDSKGEKFSQKTGFSLRNDIHIHLPPSSDVSVYIAIFRALREELLD